MKAFERLPDLEKIIAYLQENYIGYDGAEGMHAREMVKNIIGHVYAARLEWRDLAILLPSELMDDPEFIALLE